jgi:hypothetical protein
MKTHKYIILLWLLVLVVATEGLGQERNQKTTLPFTEVTSLRNQLLEDLSNEMYLNATITKKKLVKNQAVPGDYLTINEYLIILFLTGEYDEILNPKYTNLNQIKGNFKYTSIESELHALLNDQESEILADINKHAIASERVLLRGKLLSLQDKINVNNEGFYDEFDNLNVRTKIKYDYDNYNRNTFESKTQNPEKGRNTRKPKRQRTVRLGINTFELGSFYKIGFFSGNLNKVYSNYQIIKPVYLGYSYNWLFFDIGFSFFGKVGKMDKGLIDEYPTEGTFYGKITQESYISVGVRFYNSNRLSFTATASYNQIFYELRFKEQKFFSGWLSNINRDATVDNNTTFGIGPGIFCDYHIWDIDELRNISMAARFRYNMFIITGDSFFGNSGITHELSIGVILKFKEEA